MKYCYACKQEKPLADFGKNRSRKDGLCAECKECVRIINREYRAKNREALSAKKREHWKKNRESCQQKQREYRDKNREACREKAREYCDRNREACREATRKYYKKHREKCCARIKRFKRRNPEKVKAHNAINHAIAAGKIKRPVRCERCFEETFVEGHHSDYSKPLEVEWLCRKCHCKAHRSN